MSEDSNNSKKTELKQLSTHLPKEFIGEFKRFVASLNEKTDPITKITEKQVVYSALREYMDKKSKG